MNMYSDKHYPKAPITEAVIDLRVELSPDVSVAELKRVHAEQEIIARVGRNSVSVLRRMKAT